MTPTKQQAIETIRAIQGGSGLDRDDVRKVVGIGEVAEYLWNLSGEFTLGYEYGYIAGLAMAFDITREDVDRKCE